VNHTPLAVGVVVGVVVVVVGAVVVVVGVVVAVIGVVVVVVGVVVVVVGVVVVVVGAEGIVDGTPVSAAPMVSLSARGAKALTATSPASSPKYRTRSCQHRLQPIRSTGQT
jgi:hypothetical protein